MTLYYALGGGWGHLARADKVLRYFGIREFQVLTAASLVQSIFAEEQLIRIPDHWSTDIHRLQTELQAIFYQKNIDRIFIDCFPAGILGELNRMLIPPAIPVFYIARYLKWDRYQAKIHQPVFFAKTYRLEDLQEAHQAFIRQYSEVEEKLELPPLLQEQNPAQLAREYSLPTDRPIWLIIHAVDPVELEHLVHYALDCGRQEGADPFFLILSNIRVKVPDFPFACFEYYPASDFFPLADAIFTGCGFNSMLETKPFAPVHRFIPFNRKYDDQFWRARHRRMVI